MNYNLLYDHRDICITFLENGVKDAMLTTKQKIYRIEDSSEEDKEILMFNFFSSLNTSIYNYLTIKEKNHSQKYQIYPLNNSLIKDKKYESIAYELLSFYDKFLKRDCYTNKHIDNACKYISEHISEELNLQKVSDNVYLSKCHLCHLFSEYHNVTFSEYITNERIKLAKILLQTTDDTIDIVSQKCGFSSSSYFSTVFKTQTSFSPTRYKMLNRKK